MKRRILAAFLAAILIFSTVPQTAYAQELPNDETNVEILENESGAEEEVAVSEEVMEDTVSEEVVIVSEAEDVVSEEEVIISEEDDIASEEEVIISEEDDIVFEEILDSEDALGLYAMESSEQEESEEGIVGTEEEIEESGSEETEESSAPSEEEDSGADIQISSFLYEVNEKNQVILTKYCGSDSQVVIPEQIDGYEVVGIGDEAFFKNNDVEQVEVPKTVTSLGKSAFFGCQNLEKVTLAGNIEKIAESTFRNCSSLKEVILPEGLRTIDEYAFRKCLALENICIPDGVCYIGYSAFEDCIALKNVHLPEGEFIVSSDVFCGCSSLNDITLPRQLTSIGSMVFAGCNNLDTIYVRNPNLEFEYSYIERVPNVTIYAAQGSKAQEYALSKTIPFVVWEEPATEVSFDCSDVAVKYGESYSFAPNILPSNCTQRMIWTSSNPNVISVDENGKAKATGYGTAVVSVTVGELTASCNVTVDEIGEAELIPVESISLTTTKMTLLPNSWRFLGVRYISPANATMQDVIWSSSDESILKIEDDGNYISLESYSNKEGTVVITAEAKDGHGAKASCVVKVSKGSYNCTSVEELESDHPCLNTEFTEKWKYTVPEAKKLVVTFDERTQLSAGNSWFGIAGKEGRAEYDIRDLAGKSVEVEGDTVELSLETLTVIWGFKVSSVEAYGIPLRGTVAIEGDSYCGSTLKAVVTDTNNTGTLQYQWMRDEEVIVGATDDTYELQREDIERTITCVVTSDREDGELRGQCSGPKRLALTVKQVEERVILSWNSFEDTQKYLVYRLQDDGTQQIIADLDSNVLEYEDTSVVLGETCEYVVEAYVDKAVVVSDPVTIQTMPVPYDISILFSYVNTKGLHIGWDIVNRVDGYRIYRKDDNGEWILVEDLNGYYNRYFYDPNVEAGRKYVYGISAYVCRDEGTELVGELVEVTETTAPEQTELRLAATVDGIELSWEKIPAGDGYVILRDATGSGRYTEIEMINDINVTSYVDTDVVGGRKYRYAIYTYCGDKKSARSENAIVAALQIPAVTLTAMDTGIKVSWKDISGAEGYYVYRKEVGGKYQKIATVTGKRYYLDKTAEGGKEYYYTVKAYAGETVSGYVSAKIKVTIAVPQTVVKATAKGVKVTWNVINGVDGYRIYRKESDGAFVKIATVKAGEDTSYLDVTAEGGVKYDYAVKSYQGTSSSGYVSVSVEAMLISPVTKLTLLDTGVKVSWTEVAGATEYYVYRKVSGGAYAKIATVAGKNYFKDTKVLAGQEYYYAVKASKGTLVSGYISDSVKLDLVAPTTAVSATADEVEVSWNAVLGAEGYRVYRKEEGGAYERIATVTGGGKTTYLNTKVPGGKTYYYAVKAYAGTLVSSYKGVRIDVPLATPTTKVTLLDTGVKVSWNLVAGAEEYYVYRKPVGGSYEQIAAVSGKNYYLDKEATAGKQYYYTVKSAAGEKISGYKSVLVTVPRKR